MTGGFIYLLINKSMPGLLKIGKTERDPSDRATELSAASGVPSSFDLIYWRYFDNVTTAESAIHTHLSERGFRPNLSREFFSCSPKDAIDAIVQHESSGPAVPRPEAKKQELMLHELISRAEAATWGTGGIFRDINAAEKMYKTAQGGVI